MHDTHDALFSSPSARAAEDSSRPAAVLVGLVTDDRSAEDMERNLDELARLLDTAGGVACARMTQAKEHPDPRSFLGSGKVEELRELCRSLNASLVVFDDELSPVQIRNLEDDLNGPSVIDRSMLILDIFALHAVTAEGKLQVELAQLQYTAPRLVGKGKDLSRLGGGVGTRGPGESRLEHDRRHIKRRIHALKEQLEEMEKNRATLRAGRAHNTAAGVAIVGYTNAGKSTLLNRLTGASVPAEDRLFATLDPTTRTFRLPDGSSVLLTDTVGLIRKLPHHLVHAFRSTLEEALYADALLILLDASDPCMADHLTVTRDLLESLGASGKPTLYVFNKWDVLSEEQRQLRLMLCADEDRPVPISAQTGEGCAALAERLQELLHGGKRRVTLRLPHQQQALLARLYQNPAAVVASVTYGDDAVTVEATVDARTLGALRAYVTPDSLPQDPPSEDA